MWHRRRGGEFRGLNERAGSRLRLNPTESPLICQPLRSLTCNSPARCVPHTVPPDGYVSGPGVNACRVVAPFPPDKDSNGKCFPNLSWDFRSKCFHALRTGNQAAETEGFGS